MKIIESMARHHKIEGDDWITLKRGVLAEPKIDRDQRTVAGMMTTTNVGIDGLIVPGAALDLSYFWGDSSGVGLRSVYFNHDYDQLPIGKCVSMSAKDEGIFVRTFITRTGIGDDLLTLIEEGCMNGLSSGMRVKEVSPPTGAERKRWGVQDADAQTVRRALLLEYSVVSMPADGESQLDNLLCRNAITRASAEFFGLKGAGTRKVWGVTMDTDTAIILNT